MILLREPKNPSTILDVEKNKKMFFFLERENYIRKEHVDREKPH